MWIMLAYPNFRGFAAADTVDHIYQFMSLPFCVSDIVANPKWIYIYSPCINAYTEVLVSCCRWYLL